MFIAALFTTGKLLIQPRCPTSDEWIKKMSFIYNGILFSHKETLSFVGKWMELENITLSEISQVWKAKTLQCFLSYVEYRPNTNTAVL
jgi:hypothetical protein